jgi:hypothetical protein
MTGAIMHAEGLDGLLDPIIDQAKEMGGKIARNVATANYNTLYGFGQKTATTVVAGATSWLPKPVQKYVLPDYVEPPPSPEWVRAIVDPITEPIVKGAKDKALQVGNRVATPIYLGGLAVVLTLLGAGYIVGRIAGSRICKLER